VPGLTRLLADPSWEVRSKAAWALGQIGDTRASTALAGALKDGRADVRKSAAWALGQMGNERE
jgi:HEAT repeat protein